MATVSGAGTAAGGGRSESKLVEIEIEIEIECYGSTAEGGRVEWRSLCVWSAALRMAHDKESGRVQ